MKGGGENSGLDPSMLHAFFWNPTGKAAIPVSLDQADTGAGLATKDRPRRVVEGPMYSPGWSSFFYFAAVAVVSLAALNTWTAPGTALNRSSFYYSWPLVALLVYLGRRLRAKGALEVVLPINERTSSICARSGKMSLN